MAKIESFTDLIAWRESHQLVLMIYRSTGTFPPRETFSLVDQMRRSAISISSNISEGFSRQGKKEKINFYYMAKGSLTELQNQLLVARDVSYITEDGFNKISAQTVTVSKLITGLIKSMRK